MKNRGFTLIELLVVIAIIAVLSTIAVLNFNSARNKGRDARRLQELANFAKGLELYYDLNGMYPCGDHIETLLNGNPITGTYDTSGSGCDSNTIDSAGFLNGFGSYECDGITVASVTSPQCVENPSGLYGAGILGTNRPSDPLGESSGDWWWTYTYHVSENRQNYILGTYLETNKGRMLNDGGMCNGFLEVGNALGTLKPWYNMACGCDGNSYSSRDGC